MKPFTRISFIALFLLLAFAATSRVATAQACSPIRFGNNTACDVDICLRTSAGIVCSGTLVPGGDGPGFTAPGAQIVGVVSAGGFFYPWVQPVPPSTLYKVQNVTLGPSNCCVDVFFDLATCTVKAVPPAAPPVPPATCNP